MPDFSPHLLKESFAQLLAANIKRTIRALKKSGTVAMGRDNLLQVTPIPRCQVGAPQHREYKEFFNAIVDATPLAKSFTNI